MKLRIVALCAVLTMGAFGAAPRAANAQDWKNKLNQQLPLMGYRNWIVIADAAYPWQNASGVETVITNADQLSVAKTVFEAIGKSKHVQAQVYTPAELPFVSEKDVPEVTAYRTELAKIVGPQPSQNLLHNQLINNVAEVGKDYRVLLLKTKGTVPYGSIFIELKAGYWTPEAEERLRAAMPATFSRAASGMPSAAPVPFTPREGAPPLPPRGRPRPERR